MAEILNVGKLPPGTRVDCVTLDCLPAREYLFRCARNGKEFAVSCRIEMIDMDGDACAAKLAKAIEQLRDWYGHA